MFVIIFVMCVVIVDIYICILLKDEGWYIEWKEIR